MVSFKDKNWKVKKEGLDKLELLFSCNMNRVKIQNSQLIDLVGGIKICLTDNNKNIVKLFTNVVMKLCVAMDVKDIR